MLMSRLLLCKCLKAAFESPGCEQESFGEQPARPWGWHGAVPVLEMHLLGSHLSSSAAARLELLAGHHSLSQCIARAPGFRRGSAAQCFGSVHSGGLAMRTSAQGS